MNSVSLANLGTDHITLATAKGWLRIDHSDDDATITAMLSESYSAIERETGRLFREATATLKLDAFPPDRRPIVLPFPALRSVTSLNYIADNGATASLTPAVKLAAIPGEILPPNGTEWPDTADDTSEPITIVYECGQQPTEQQSEITGCLRIMLELAFHDLTPLEMQRLEMRRNAILRRWRIRDGRLSGITHN